jgi:hypothetical protein
VGLDLYLIDTLMRGLVRHDRSPASYLVYLWKYRQAHGAGRGVVAISYAADATGLSKRSVQTAVGRLLGAALASKATGAPHIHAGLYSAHSVDPGKATSLTAGGLFLRRCAVWIVHNASLRNGHRAGRQRVVRRRHPSVEATAHLAQRVHMYIEEIVG